MSPFLLSTPFLSIPSREFLPDTPEGPVRWGEKVIIHVLVLRLVLDLHSLTTYIIVIIVAVTNDIILVVIVTVVTITNSYTIAIAIAVAITIAVAIAFILQDL